MSQPNEPVQNYEVQSPAIETLLRTQLPSVAGYGGLVRATNTIIPVLDVSAAAEGSTLPLSLQNALAFGSVTAYSQIGAGTTTIVNTPGFYRIFGNVTCTPANAVHKVSFELTNGATSKIIWETGNLSNIGTSQEVWNANLDFIVFLATGDSLSTTGSTNNYVASVGSSRQIATSDGTLVNPSGFPV